MKHIDLIGESAENFYQLGLKDRGDAHIVLQDMKSLLKTPWNPVNKAIIEAARATIKRTLLKKTHFLPFSEEYAKGAGMGHDDFAYALLIPELLSFMSLWAPGMIRGNLGCSSFMTRNKDGEIIHGRILDFPLQGSFDRFERSIYYDLENYPKMIGLGTSGMPYPSIHLMTEDGITLALHQKFTKAFYSKGESIFSYIFSLIQNARDLKSVLEFAKYHHSLTTWCLYMTFPSGEALGLEVSGKEHTANIYKIPDGKKGEMLYFCNHLENKALDQSSYLPLGFHEYNCMREKIAHKKIKNWQKTKNGACSDLELLHLMASPLDQKLNQNEIQNYSLDTITPSSLTAMVFNPTKQEINYIPGHSPKTFRNEIILYRNIFQKLACEIVKSPSNLKFDLKYEKGLRSIMKAQRALDSQNTVEAYHFLQIAIEDLQNYPEKKIVQFYFNVVRFMFEGHQKILPDLLAQFKFFQNNLPPYLNDHCNLFIFRLEKILGLPLTIETHDIKHPKLQALLKLESKIPKIIYAATVKKSLIPRIDLLDIISIFTK